MMRCLDGRVSIEFTVESILILVHETKWKIFSASGFS